MKTINKFLTILMVLSMALAMGACSESNNNEEPDGPVKPDQPVADNWHSVSAAGGTVEEGDITLQFDPSTFSSNVEIGISEIKASDITEDSRSKFYQLILPPSGTKKPFTLKLKCTGSTENVRPLVKTIAWDLHSGKTGSVVFDIDATVSGGEIVASIPELSSDGKEKPYFTIGLAECPPVDETRADGFRYQYKVGAPIWKFNSNKSKYQEISDIVKKSIPEATSLLNALGFNIKTLVQYRLSSPKEVAELKDCWGIHKPAWYGKSWNVVHLNEDYFMEYLGNKTEGKLNDLKATIIHETLHAITALLYDPRSGYTICNEGQKGNDWSQFDEGLGCWVEKVIGAKEISENTKAWQKDFIREFYPHKRDQFACRDCGYGMASFIEFMAQRTGDTKIVDIYKAFEKETTSFRTVLKSFLSGNNIQFFDVQNYYDFAYGVMSSKIVPQIDIDDCVSSIEGLEGKVDIMKEKNYTFKADAYNYGILVHKLNFNAEYMRKNQDSLVSINQYKPGVLTRIYYKKNNGIVLLGQCVEDDNLVIDMKEINKKTGIYDNTPPSFVALYFVTTRNEFKDDYSSMPSSIEIRVQNGEMPAHLEVSPKLLEFEPEGGEQAITVKKGYFQLSNCFWEDNQQWGWNKQFDNDTTIIVKVPENTTTEERTTKLIVWAANKSFDQIDMEKDDCDTAVVVIRQKGKEPAHLEVSPKLLEFEADGGELPITVNKGDFKLSHCFWDENQQWGWSTRFDNGTSIVVSLPENTTSEEREAKLIVWAANKDYNELDMQKDRYDTVIVIIRQKAQEVQKKSRYEFAGGRINMAIRTEYELGGMGAIEFTVGDDIVTMTPKGKGMHFELNWNGNDDKYTDVIHCTFDIDDTELMLENKASVNNLSWKRETNNWSGPNGHHWWGIWAYTDFLLKQTQDIAFATSQKIPQLNWNEPWMSEYYSANFWIFDPDLQSPSTCYFHRWTLGQYVDGEAESVENGDEMLEGSSIAIDLWFKYVEE